MKQCIVVLALVVLFGIAGFRTYGQTTIDPGNPQQILKASGGAAKWQSHAIHDSSRGQDGLEFGDPNGDGHLDLVSAFEIDQSIKVMINPGKSSKAKQRWQTVKIASTPDPEDAMFADLDADGNLDIIVSQGEGNSREGQEPGVKVLWAPPFSQYLNQSSWSSGLTGASAWR